MTASNHALTGAIIALAIDKPVIALPMALISHFVLDALPHYDDQKRFPHSSRGFLLRLCADAALTCSLLIFIVTFLPTMWPLVVACALLAIAPDLMWAPGYLRIRDGLQLPAYRSLKKWHKGIQRYERPWGIFVEIAWFVAGLWLLMSLIAKTL